MKNRCIVLFALLALVISAAPVRADSPSSPLVLLEIRGMDQFSRTAIEVADAWDQTLEEEIIAGGVAGLFGLTSLEGLDLSGTIQIALFFSMEHAAGVPPVLLSLPIEPGNDTLRQALEEAWPVDEDQASEDIVRLTRPTDRPVQLPIQALFLKESDDRLLLASHPNAIADLPPRLDRVEGTLALALMPERIAQTLAPMFEMQMESMREMIEQMPEEDREQFDLESMQAGQQIVLAFFGEIDLFGFGVTILDNILALNTALEAVPDSVAAKLLHSMETPSDAFLRLIPDDALVATVGHVKVPDELPDAYVHFMQPLLQATPEQAHLLPLVKSSMELMKGQYAGDYAMAFLPPKAEQKDSWALVQAWRIADADWMKETMDEYLASVIDLMKESAPDQKDAIERQAPRSYREIEIYRYSMDATMGVPDAEEAIREMMPLLLNMNMEYAFIGDIMITSMGSPEGMNGMIDRALDGGTSLKDAAAIRRHFPALPDNFIDLVAVRPVAFIRAMGEMIPVMPIDWAEALEDDLAIMAGYGMVDGNRTHSHMRMDYGELVSLIQALPERQKPELGATASYGAGEGEVAPDFELELLEGETFRLADQRGKTVLIDFWATWCPPCVESLPYLQGMYEELASDDLVFIGVSIDRPGAEERVKQMVERFGLSYPVGINDDSLIAVAYGARSIPTLIIVDAEGVIRHQKVGFSASGMEEVKDILRELTGQD